MSYDSELVHYLATLPLIEAVVWLYLPHAFMLGLFVDFEDGGDMFLRNVG
jgi:hypothetical protein